MEEGRSRHFEIGAITHQHMLAMSNLKASADMHSSLHTQSVASGETAPGAESPHYEAMYSLATAARRFNKHLSPTRTNEFHGATKASGQLKIKPVIGGARNN